MSGEYGSHCSPAIWNQFENKGHRTNNAVESFHSKMNKILKVHSDILTVIKYFQDEDLEMSNIYANTVKNKKCLRRICKALFLRRFLSRLLRPFKVTFKSLLKFIFVSHF